MFSVSLRCGARLALGAPPQARLFSTDKHDYDFLVVGGGSAGCSMAAKITRNFPQCSVAVLEPAEWHYYQPLFTLVGAGSKQLQQSRRPMRSVLPRGAAHLRDAAASFSPSQDSVTTAAGRELHYRYLIIAAGLQLRFEQIPGLQEALSSEDSGVCSVYSPLHVEKTWRCVRQLRSGRALFTFPNTPVKCPGAPQKIMYLTEDYLKKNNIRKDVEISYHSSLGVIFGVKKYADALWKHVQERGIDVNLRRDLVEVRPQQRQAVFQLLDHPGQSCTEQYSLLHVTPPMGAVDALQRASALVDAAGLVQVDKHTLQHRRFHNIFALGDCTDSPNSKTAAAVAAQSAVVEQNLKKLLAGQELTAHYDGYASCPLITAYDRCILAEFDYDLKPLETFPVDQSVERYSMYLMKAHAMAPLYWQLMTRGRWDGPGALRRLLQRFKTS